MPAILSNLRATVHISLLLAIIYLGAYVLTGGIAVNDALWMGIARWTHVVSGIMWIGLLWYFNFVQIPNMPNIPDEQKPAIGKVIAPAALFWFRWGAAATVLTGLFVAGLRGYTVEVLSLGLAAEVYTPQYSFIGIGMWMAIIMAYNVWFIIWPNQQIALGLVEADAEAKPKAARTAMLFSRTNTLLSFPMLVAMAMAQTVFG
ncbi:urate hydroxylase PuuD [uncultured Maricaulis sp.]|uniref:urate hydroxylase PuuD n=1 Tax=uncultured Maricaulis sp. TaxID=174710 RepID=UPI0030DA9A50|tara:strand:+ start:7240 stop:7848 length:609 start_codon:yes stop_codon:yes gene_type:complete